MDEPLSNLDAKLRVQMRADIQALQQELGVTTIYVTHDQIEAMTMGDRVAVMRKGVLQQVDAPQVLYDDPDNLFVAGFIGSPPMNMARGDDPRGRRHVAGPAREPAAPHRPRVRGVQAGATRRTSAVTWRSACGPRISASPDPRNDVPEDQRLRSTAKLTEALGSEIVVHFVLDAPPVETEDTKELKARLGPQRRHRHGDGRHRRHQVRGQLPPPQHGDDRRSPSRSASTRPASTSSTSTPASPSAENGAGSAAGEAWPCRGRVRGSS